jgi:LPS-assembly protein
MKNKLFIIIFVFSFNTVLFAENIIIQAKNITLDKNKETSVFKNEVFIQTADNDTIKSDFAEYNKKDGFLELKGNIVAIDNKNNNIETQYAEYDEKKKIFISIGRTKIITSQNYIIEGEDIILDNNKNYIESNKDAVVTDLNNNKIYLKNFTYQTKSNIFKSIGYVKIKDSLTNTYEFSQIYIDTKKKEIIGADIKAFLNDENLKINESNKPRIFASTANINNEKSKFNKSIFTLCDYRENDKCPPWSIQASEMLHDNKKKTIYYDNAVIKVYNIPIFYFPKLSHPDPSVDRRSGFLSPTILSSKNLGSGLSVPYFFALNKDKNFTFTNRLYMNENPLFLGEYHQDFKYSNFLADFGYTQGYKKSDKVKKISGEKSHFFSKYVKNFINLDAAESSLSLTTQNVSNNKYLKLYKIDSNLVDYNTNTLKNSLDYLYEKEDLFFGLNTSVYETLNDNYNDKYEYILPEITLNKNLISSKTVGIIDLQTNYKVRNYDTNKNSSFLVNDFLWNSNTLNYNSGIQGKFIGNFKNINYETKNIDLYKKEPTSEIYGALGYLSELDLVKRYKNSIHKLKPKLFFRYAPGNMRKEDDGFRLDPNNAFNINRINNTNNFEAGLSSTVGFDYKIKKNMSDFNFSVAQIINEKENKKMSTKTSLDEKLSDLVGSAKYQINDKIDFNYNFSVDQNYNDLNYNEIGTSLNFSQVGINFNYLEENKHIGDQKYFKTKFDYTKSDNGVFSFETKQNLITDSAEFYNLSYEYLNDCLRAGLVYRREFYKDSELEPEDSLMFKITLTPFGNINSPSFNN